MNAATMRKAFQPSDRRRARGSILVNTAIALSLIAITLVGTELGYLFYMKRELQKTADLAALAGAQKLTPPGDSGTCSASDGPQNAALASANQNFPGIGLTEMKCGHWDPANATPASPVPDDCFIGTDDHFLPEAFPENAFRVRIKKTPATLLPFFEGNRNICVQAVAALDAPVAAFTVGSRLLRLEDNTLLPNLLKAIGLDLSPTDLLSYRGLANTSITPAGLLAALGVPVTGDLNVGTLNQLASIEGLALGGLIDATVIALQNQGGTVDASIALLRQLQGGLSAGAVAAKVKLFGNETSPGILVGLDTTGNAALNSKVDLLSLVTAGASIANGKNLIAIDNLGIGILGVQAKASVIEPPSIGIGGVGAIARTAQIRAYLRITPPLLGLDLPLILELAQSTGELKNINCKAPRHNATIAVSSSQVNVCLGRFHDMTSEADSNSSHFFTENNRCAPNSSGAFPDSAEGVRRHRILNVLGLGAVSASARVGLPVLASQAPVETNPPLNVPSSPSDGTSQTTITATGINPAQIVSSAARAVTDGILGDLGGQGLGLLLGTITGLLKPVFDILSQVLAALLSTLGISIGQTDVSLLSVDCGVAKLVH
ncbi:pilus assembly protein TadG-related protein [Variovorax sp. Root411]|uniref:pilus assembly protein TadG-related protein n=1 Tax=Variovorax sp. Root411 TaxID=1736530 RepID=UPI0009E8B403|nr:pilus assembly protein TadG-related protein [Variovorax sp. Root411]